MAKKHKWTAEHRRKFNQTMAARKTNDAPKASRFEVTKIKRGRAVYFMIDEVRRTPIAFAETHDAAENCIKLLERS